MQIICVDESFMLYSLKKVDSVKRLTHLIRWITSFSSLLSTLPSWVWCERPHKSFSTNSCKFLEALFELLQYCPVCLWLYPHVVLYTFCCHVQFSLSYRLPRVTALVKCLLLSFYTCDFMWKQEAQPCPLSCIHQHNYTTKAPSVA